VAKTMPNLTINRAVSNTIIVVVNVVHHDFNSAVWQFLSINVKCRAAKYNDLSWNAVFGQEIATKLKKKLPNM
jgi:hypothetical protein